MGNAAEEIYGIRRGFVILLLAIFGYLSYRVFEPFITYVFLAGLFVYLLYPLYRATTRWTRRPRLAAGLVLLFFMLTLLAPLVWVTIEVAATVTSTVEAFDSDSFIEGTDHAINTLYDFFGISYQNGESTTARLLNATLPDIQARLQQALPGVLTFAGSFAIGLFVMAFSFYYGLLDGPRFIKYVRGTLPLDEKQASALTSGIRRTVDAVFLGHIIVSLVQGVVGGIGFVIFGVPNAVFWGFVMIIMALIPLIGPPVVWGPAVIFLFMTGHIVPAIGLLIWSALLVSTLDNFLRPRIVGTRADIHPLVVLVGVLGGLAAFGVIGFVTGPLVIAILVAVVNFWRTDYLPQARAPAHGAPPPPMPPPTTAGGRGMPPP